MNSFNSWTFSFLFLLHVSIFSQHEVKVDLQGNPILIGKAAYQANYKMPASDTVQLPFIDDFSLAGYYPDSSKWTSISTFINRTYAIAPPTIGVATFDGLDFNGYPYNFGASLTSSNPADTLLSKYIKLGSPGTPADSVYLSFFYQARGRGNTPETPDSLVLEFRSSTKNWTRIWGKGGYSPSSSDTGFHLVMIPITDTNYFKKGFRLRFRNNATLSGALDHWHIDYVYLNKNRNFADTVFTDVAYAYNAPSFLKKYTAMPWEQYLNSELKDSVNLFVRNNAANSTSANYTDSVVQLPNTTIYAYNGGSCSIDPFVTNGYATCKPHAKSPVGFTFPTMNNVTTFVGTHRIYPGGSDQISENNFVQYEQKFDNYFAYDDGTAESGYGLNTNGAKLAYRFTLNTTDTLRAINLFFTPILTSVTGFPFRLAVWDDNGGQPNNLVYKDSIVYPKYSNDYSDFSTYLITNPSLVLGAGTYYFGWIQSGPDILNIGLDENTDAHSQVLYNVLGSWQPSSIKGSLMLRPVFGKKLLFTGVENNETPGTLTVWPNPTSDILNITANNTNEKISIELTNQLGQTLIKQRIEGQSGSIDLSSISAGLYLLHIHTGNTISYKPVIITR